MTVISRGLTFTFRRKFITGRDGMALGYRVNTTMMQVNIPACQTELRNQPMSSQELEVWTMSIIDQVGEHEPSLREYLSQVPCGNR